MTIPPRCRVPFLAASLLFLGLSGARAADNDLRPLRVACLAPIIPSKEINDKCHALMEELGRDAIFIDYFLESEDISMEYLRRFDLMVKAGEVKDAADLRGRLQSQVKPARLAAWQAFQKQREPEIRRPDPNVANYEKRPQAVTLQEPFSVKGSMERTQVPIDMKLQLFAAEPDIAKPIAMAWDERGRCWVAETRDYPHGVSADGAGNDSIKICEDTDGDGRADKFTVFADKLNLPTSLVFARGGLIVSQPPNFLFLKDTDGDDRADTKQTLIEGWGIKDTHAQASNLHYGLDNFIHGCVGYSGFKGTSADGKPFEFTMGTYRFNPAGGQVEFLHQFTNNAWAHSANAAGDQFGGTANGAPIFYGGIPAGLFPKGMRGMSAKRINVEEKVHAITPNYRQVDVFGGYTAAAGSAFIESANLPPRLQGKAMVCEPTMKVITLMDVQPRGAGYVARDGFNLVASTDEWMSPVFAEVGPDGAVWFADWQNFIIQHNPTPSAARGGYDAKTGAGGAHENSLRDHARGRIYRVVWDQAKPPAVKTLQNAGVPELVKALSSDTPLWRLTAQRLLVDGKKAEAAEALQALVKANDGRIAALHALWTLHGLGKLDEATHKAALLAKDPSLRRNAVRALGTDGPARALFHGSGVVGDAVPVVRLAALVKLAQMPVTDEVRTLAVQLSKDPAVKSDEWLTEITRVLRKNSGADAAELGPNLLANASFETLSADKALPEGWARRDYGDRPGNTSVEWKVVKKEGRAVGGDNFTRCIAKENADTSLHFDVTLKPDTEYGLSAWIRTKELKGKASLNDHIGRYETEKITKNGDWAEVETIFNSGKQTRSSINLLLVGSGEVWFDEVRLSERMLKEDAEKLLAGDAGRGAQIVLKHPAAACILCHMVKGQGSTVGPALDGIATRQTAAQIRENLVEPNKTLAKGYEILGISPMPPMGLILKPQELEDVQAYLQTLK